MSDQQQPTPVDLLVDRLSQRVGQLTVENEWLKVQIDLMQQEQQAEMQDKSDPDSRLSAPNANGEASHDVQSVI